VILAKFCVKNASPIANQLTNANNSYSDFCKVTSKREVSSIKQPDSVHRLLGNSAINFLASYTLCCLNSLIKTGSSTENTNLLLFMMTASTNATFDRVTAAGYVTPYWKGRYFVIDIQL